MDLTTKDEDGFKVMAGTRIAFSYGIPPVRVVGRVIERDGQLILPTPGHKPNESTLEDIVKHCGGFWRVDVTDEEIQAQRAAENAEYFSD